MSIEKKPYHHLPDGTFRNPEGSPKRDDNVKWSYKIFNAERKKIKMDRLEKITISAMKQSLQLHKPILQELVSFEGFIKNCKSEDKFIIRIYEYNLNPSKLAIVWCLLNKNVSTVILGASKQEQLEENLSSIELKPLIDETLIQKLNNI